MYYQGYPSLSKNWAETGNLNPSKYIQDVTTDVLTMYQKAGILKEVAENPANVFKYLKNEDIPKDLAGLGMQTADIVKRDLQHKAGILKEVAENPANVFKYLKNEDIPKDLAGLGMQTADIVKRDLQHGANNIVKTGKPLVGSTDILQDAIDQ